MRLLGKRALVTGAASEGMGREIVKAFAKEGASIVFNYHTREAQAQELQDYIRTEYGTKIEKYQADCGDPEEVKAMIDWTVQELGGLDILVCSNGVDHQTLFKDMRVEDWDWMYRNSMRSIFLLNRYAIPYMLEQKSGRIINVTSQIGQIGCTDGAHYAANKAGVIAMTKSIAREVSQFGINVNCIAPGPIANEFFLQGSSKEWIDNKLADLPMGRFGENFEVAPTAVFLAAEPDGNLYVGQTLGPNCGDVML